MNNFAVLTMHSQKYHHLADATRPSKAAYCNQHGYTLYHEGPDDESAKMVDRYGFGRLERCLQILNLRDGAVRMHCGVVWLGADVGVSRLDARLEDIVRPGAGFTVTADRLGINSDVFICVNVPFTRQFLASITDNITRDHYKDHPWHEQQAMIEMLTTYPYNRPSWLDYKEDMTELQGYCMKEMGFPTDFEGQWVRDKTPFIHVPGFYDEHNIRISLLQNRVIC